MTDKELFKLALDALEANYLLVNGTETHGGLEQCLDGYYSSCFDTDPINKQTEEAINALKERLADPMREVQRLGQEIEQEPVCPDCKAKVLYECVACSSNNYPPRRTWVGLTEEDRAKILSRKWWDFEDEFDVDGFLRLAEAKLKEKNT